MSKPYQIAGTEAQASEPRRAESQPVPAASATNVYQNVCTNWLRRRTEDMQIGMEAAKRLSECRDITQAASIYSKWVSESVGRLKEEISSVTEQNSALGNQYLDTLTSLASVIPEKAAQFGPPASRRTA